MSAAPAARVACVLALLGPLLAAPARAQEPAPGDDWPRLLGPDGDGRSRETGLALDWDAAGPPLLWQVEADLGFAAPVVAGSRAFVFDRVGDEARLRALDAATGALRWDVRYPTHYEDYYGYSPGPRAAPVVAGERVCVHGVEGRLRCLSVSDGSLLWEVDTAKRYGVVRNFFGVGATPLVEAGLLIVPVGGSPPDSPRIHSGQVAGDGTGLVAFDLATGEERWRSSDELASYASPVVAEVAGRRRGFAFMRGGLLGFDPRDGRIELAFPWRSKTLESVNASNPVVVGDRVLIAECYGPGGVLLRVRGDEAEVVWSDASRGREQALRTHWMTPIVEQGVIYASSGRNAGDAELRAVELDTGAVLWSEPGLGRSTLLLADGRLLVLTEFGRLLAVEPSRHGFEPVADATPELPGEPGTPVLESPAWAPPALSRGRLLVRGKTRLACFDLRAPPAGTAR